MTRYGSVCVLLLLLSACASGPTFKLENIDYALTPNNAARSDHARGHRVVWGGTILASNNFKDHTRVEVLAYPVDNEGNLNTGAEPLGRFYALYPGYLETAEYKKNRWLSLTGTYIGMESGNVGGADYAFPVVEVTQLYLWTEDALQNSSPNVHFGIGVMFH